MMQVAQLSTTTFSGEITRIATGRPSYRTGEYPELIIDFLIRAHDLSWWELEWHAYVAVLKPEGGEIAVMHRSDFEGGIGPPPNPDIRQVVGVKMPLFVPMGTSPLPVLVQLYGSTTVWQPQGFIQEKPFTIPLEAPPPPPPPPDGDGGRISWGWVALAGGVLGLMLLTRKEK